MHVLIAYDVSTIEPVGAKRLRRVARACKDYGQRAQKSLFECHLSATDWVSLRDRLLSEIDLSEDSIRFYFLAGDTRIEHHGVNTPIDPTDALIV
jgi:CRISPR-associated protein Cas2